jgi:hypothetical protein
MCPKCAASLEVMELRELALLARESMEKWKRTKQLASKSDLTHEERAQLPESMRAYNEHYLNQCVSFMQSKIEQAERIHTKLQEMIKVHPGDQPLTRYC